MNTEQAGVLVGMVVSCGIIHPVIPAHQQAKGVHMNSTSIELPQASQVSRRKTTAMCAACDNYQLRGCVCITPNKFLVVEDVVSHVYMPLL